MLYLFVKYALIEPHAKQLYKQQRLQHLLICCTHRQLDGQLMSMPLCSPVCIQQQ